MNKKILKQVSLLSLLLGAILGIITTIPFVGTFAFWVLMCFVSTAILLFMVKNELLTINKSNELPLQA